MAEGLRLDDRVWMPGPAGRPRFGVVCTYRGPAGGRRMVVRWDDGPASEVAEAELRPAARVQLPERASVRAPAIGRPRAALDLSHEARA